MDELDNLLQNQLHALETGQSTLEPQDLDGEIGPLLRLAVSLRTVDGPHLSSGRIHNGRQQAIGVALAADRDRRQPESTKRASSRWLALGIVPAAIALALMIPIALLILAGGLYWSATRAAGQVSLEGARGYVSIARIDDPDGWEPIESGEVSSGWQIRTGGDSAVSLVFHEGTRVDLGPDTEIILDQVGGGWGGALEMSLSQVSGTTLHHVVPLRGDGSFYVVQTPAGMAEVHGTTFSVEVAETGDARVQVDSGRVTVAGAGDEVILLAGQATKTSPGRSPEPPAYQFSGEGVISVIQGTTWWVGGVPVTVIDQTSILGGPGAGDYAAVRGRILDGGLWLADEIERLDHAGRSSFSFSGRLDTVEGGVWVVGGKNLLVNDATVIDGDPQAGDTVIVTFHVVDGGAWLALRISSRNEDGREPTPTPAATRDPSAQPGLSFQPDEMAQSGCGDRFRFSGSLVNTAGGEDDYAANVQLGYILVENPEYVSSVRIDPSSWETIPAGAAVHFDVLVELNESWMRSRPGTEVKLRVFIASETNRPREHQARLTLTVVGDCGIEPTPSRTITPTFTVTPARTPTTSVTPSPSGPTDCTGADPHPHGMTLAERYGVPYEEIMGWFCQGFGFGEIEHAYTLSQQTGVPVAEIFALRRSGLGWGQIKKQLTGGPKPKKK